MQQPRRRDVWQDYARIVAWLADVVGTEDKRGFDATPMFLFAYRYNLLHWTPPAIYEEFVRYQCVVYERAAAKIAPAVVNTLSFGELQQLFESGQL